jgi:hypothetical protein
MIKLRKKNYVFKDTGNADERVVCFDFFNGSSSPFRAQASYSVP